MTVHCLCNVIRKCKKPCQWCIKAKLDVNKIDNILIRNSCTSGMGHLFARCG